MDSESELNSLRHAKNVWRGIATGLPLVGASHSAP